MVRNKKSLVRVSLLSLCRYLFLLLEQNKKGNLVSLRRDTRIVSLLLRKLAYVSLLLEQRRDTYPFAGIPFYFVLTKEGRRIPFVRVLRKKGDLTYPEKRET